MRKFFYSLFLSLLFSLSALAQTEGISFQGLARNAAGEVLVSQKISLRLSILLDTESGAVAYVETRQVTTNPQGIFSLVIGDDKALTKSTNFSAINWTPAPKFIKVEMDPNGGTSYVAMGTSRLQAVPFAFHAYGVDAANVKGVLPVASGGTGATSISDLKTSLGLDQVNNSALDTKVDKVAGKGLSTNDYTTAEKTKLAAITGTNTGDQDLSSYATTTQLAAKANSSDVTTSLASKVDKEIGKGLSTNDYTTAEKTKLAAITGTNTGQDLSGYATTAQLANKANASDVTTSLATKANTADVTTSLATKVDKVTGKELSTNDYTSAEKTKLAAITGTNTGDQDLSGFATTAQLATKANASDVTTSLAAKANTADVTTSLASKVDKEIGKGLSTNDYTTAEKTKLAAITGTNTGQDLSGYATTAQLANKANASDVTTGLAAKANASDVTTSLASKVDKVTGKELSTNDYTTAEKTKLAAITGTNTGDQDLSSYATTNQLATKANASDVTTSLASKVDKVTGKELSTNDFTTAEKTKLAGITGINTGDQDLSGYATTSQLATKPNASDVTTSLATKEDVSNKSNAALGTSTTFYPTQNAVKTYVDAQILTATIADADASTKGKVQLAGDLAGTGSSAAAPIISDNAITTIKINANAVTSAKIADDAIVNADINTSAAIADTKLATIATLGKVSNSATTATDANTSSAIVARDANGNFTAGTITANLTGNVTGNLSGNATNVTGTVAVANGGTGVATAAANAVFAGPASGASPAAPSFRGLVAADLPSGSTNYINNTTTQQLASFNISGSGTVGTGLTLSALTASSPVFTDADKKLTSAGTLGISQGGTGLTATPANGQILIGNGTGFSLANLTQGTGITITNSSGSISIAASAAAVRPTTDQFSATANQLTFTLTQTPLTNANSKDNVWMFINGVRTNNDAYSVSGTTVTYVPGSNGSYALLAGDRVQFDYTY